MTEWLTLDLLFQLRELIGRDDDNEGREAVNEEMFRLCDRLEAECNTKGNFSALVRCRAEKKELEAEVKRLRERVEELEGLDAIAEANRLSGEVRRLRELAEAYRELYQAFQQVTISERVDSPAAETSLRDGQARLDTAREHVRKAEQ